MCLFSCVSCMCVCVWHVGIDREKGMETFYYQHTELSQITMQLFENIMDWNGH